MKKITPIIETHKHYFVASFAIFLGLFFGLVIYPKIALPANTPSAPTSVSAVGQDSAVVLSWGLPESDGGFSISDFKVYISTVGDEERAGYFLVPYSGSGDLEYTFTDLINDTEYSVGVSAVNKNGEGEFSGWYQATPHSIKLTPSAPQDMTLVSMDGGINVSWSEPVDGAPINSYKIYYSETERNEFSVLEISTSEKDFIPSYDITSLVNDTQYSVYLTAVNEAGEGDATEIMTVTPSSGGGDGGGEPLEISGDPLVTTTSNSATITWTTNKASSSLVYYGPINDLSGSTPEENKLSGVSGHSITISSLPSCVRFWFKAASYDDSLNYVESIGGEFSTKGCKGDSTIVVSDVKKVSSLSGASIEAKLAGKGIEVAVPAGVKDGTSLAIEALKLEKDKVAEDISSPSGKTWVGDHAYSLKALDENSTVMEDNFDRPVSVSIDYTRDDLDGLNPNSLRIYHYEDGSGWMVLSSCTNNYNEETGAGVITCYTNSFSVFGLFGDSNFTSYGSSNAGGSSKNDSVSVPPAPNKNTTLVFTKNLFMGLSDPEVRLLQIFLNSKGFFVASSGAGSEGNETSYFGVKTRNALIHFQEAYKESILTPLGLSNGTGFFGERTRNFVNFFK